MGVLVIIAYFPFDWDPPRTVRNTVSRQADGSLRFGTLNRARTPDSPAWLVDARRTGQVDIHLVVLPRFPQAQPESAIMVLATDDWHLDFWIAQSGSAVALRVRRGGSTVNGEPQITMDGVFRPGHWTELDLMVRPDRLALGVDGVTRLDRRIPPGSLRLWTRGQVALGGEVHGGLSWQGLIRVAEVRTASGSVDYVASGALSVPATYLYLPDRVMPFPPPTSEEWVILLFHLVSFIPLGFLARGSRRPPVSVTGVAVFTLSLALALAAGKFLFLRHAAVADVVVEVIGGLLGARGLDHVMRAWTSSHRRLLIRRGGGGAPGARLRGASAAGPPARPSTSAGRRHPRRRPPDR
jgi:VanZ family protein